ncbi:MULTISPECIES: hypothetical protein, partial [unclassified Microcoleus]|uniref:hypothetical protein n=1 Tax=unclassified Microcoleus TaxID=2642155 RepID=UPI002FD07B01
PPDLAKCARYRASHSLIPVFKGRWSIRCRDRFSPPTEDSNPPDLAKCARYRASHSLIPVFKGRWSIEWTTINCGRFPTG